MTATIQTADRARELLHTAADASKQLEESVRELVAMRAWEVLGYADFSEMWEKENGFKIPSYVKILAANFMMDEGMLSQGRRPIDGATGHRQADVGRAIGFAVNSTPTGDVSRVISRISQQRAAGVPVEHQSSATSQGRVNEVIAAHGQVRARQQPRRMGKSPDELVQEGFQLSRRDADAIYDIAREANVPKSEIYRQAVAEYLARHRASRPVTFSGAAS